MFQLHTDAVYGYDASSCKPFDLTSSYAKKRIKKMEKLVLFLI